VRHRGAVAIYLADLADRPVQAVEGGMRARQEILVRSQWAGKPLIDWLLARQQSAAKEQMEAFLDGYRGN